MKGTIIDFIELANKTPELTQAILDLAAQYDFEFSDEVSDEALEEVAGGMYFTSKGGGSFLAFPDVCKTPPPGGPVAIPYPNTGMGTGDDGTSDKVVPGIKGVTGTKSS
jgi:hypothetical protein